MSGRVVVVGAGIAGLNAARRVRDAGVEPILFESTDRAGGSIRTDRFDGFIVDGGPDSFLTTRPWALQLAIDLGLRSELQGTRGWRHRAFVNRGGALRPMPDGMSGLVPAGAQSWLSARMLRLPGRLRAAFGSVRPTGAESGMSVASFLRGRYGKEAWDWLLEPLLAGIHGGDGERLELASTFPQLAVASGDGPTGRTSVPDAELGAFATPVAGMQMLTDALVEQLRDVDVRLETPVARIERYRTRWRVITDRGDAVDAESVIIAVPATAAAEMLTGATRSLADRLRTIPFSSSVVVHVAFDESAVPGGLEGHGYLNPRVAGRPVAACTWTSSKFENRAPAGAILLRAFIKGGAADPMSLGDDAAWGLVADEFRDVLGITQRPAWFRVHRFSPGMPQYVVGHADRVADIDRRTAELPGLFLAGNSYGGIGIPDTIRRSDHMADQALAHARRLAVPSTYS